MFRVHSVSRRLFACCHKDQELEVTASQRCVAGWAAPQELQKRVPAGQGCPQAVQKKLAPAGGCEGCAGATTGRCESEESAQTSAMIQPMKVHPARMFKMRMEVKLGLFRARNAGRK